MPTIGYIACPSYQIQAITTHLILQQPVQHNMIFNTHPDISKWVASLMNIHPSTCNLLVKSSIRPQGMHASTSTKRSLTLHVGIDMKIPQPFEWRIENRHYKNKQSRHRPSVLKLRCTQNNELNTRPRDPKCKQDQEDDKMKGNGLTYIITIKRKHTWL